MLKNASVGLQQIKPIRVRLLKNEQKREDNVDENEQQKSKISLQACTLIQYHKYLKDTELAIDRTLSNSNQTRNAKEIDTARTGKTI